MTARKDRKTVNRRSRTAKDKVYDDIAYSWQDIDDPPYKLDAQELRSMQKMEFALDFILKRLNDMSMTMEQCAAAAGYDAAYFERAFRSYYGIPFSRFVTKLRLREAARDIMSGVYADAAGKEYGFSSIQSFSKAFRNEFGVSPREFKVKGYEVPDMPLRHTIKGLPITLEYRSVNAFRMNGTEIQPPMGDDTFLMDQNAFIFSKEFSAHDYPSIDLESPQEQIGIWWYEPESGMKYVFGPVTERCGTAYLPAEETPRVNDHKQLTVLGGSYAVFSFPRPSDSTRIHLMSRILSRFISWEWIPMNRKQRNTMGCSYLSFDAERICEYVPLSSGMGVDDVLRTSKWSIQSWSDFIDENITENLTLQSLALNANYSVQNYRDVFSMYYGMTPAEYISRRRLLLASSDIAAGEEEKKVLSRYRFGSRNQFDREYKASFGSFPGEHSLEDEMLTDLIDYYAANKENVKISYRNEPLRRVLLHSIEESPDSAIPDDLVGRMVYWFVHDFRDFINIKDIFACPEEKLFIWGNEAELVRGQQIYKYYEGTVLRKDLKETEEEIIAKTDDAWEDEIPGGKYAVFSTMNDNDIQMTEDAVRLLTRCAFGGYINENRWRVELTRRTFITWVSRKLYFYVPIVR